MVTMDQVVFEHSLKNIPMPSKKEYLQTMLNSTEKLINNLRWRASHYLKPPLNKERKEKFGFKSIKAAPFVLELKQFEDSLLAMVKSIEFNGRTNQFMEELKKDCDDLNKEKRLLISADKTANLYLMDHKEHKELLQRNVQKEYKKVNEEDIESTREGHTDIVKRLEIQDRVFATWERKAFITLKDHKQNFINNPACRLINPMKPEIGRVSKKILEKINRTVRDKAQLTQWKNTNEVLEWFKGLSEKKELTFIQFDVVNFYPSITKELLEEAIDMARGYTEITEEEKSIIIKAKESYLFAGGSSWTKKGDSKFDVGMGSMDGAETCELVGLLLLLDIREQNMELKAGIYRDDGLAAVRASPQETEGIKKKIGEIFKKRNLNITIEANLNSVNFLDVNLNLQKDIYRPYAKPNDNPCYIHKMSNHPPAIIRNIPDAVNKRLSDISSNEEVFMNAVPVYQKALEKSGYKHTLKYEGSKKCKGGRQNRARKITWFNPPYSMNVKTNIGEQFLKLIEKEFHVNHPLRKIANRNTIKLSYKCMPNFARKIAAHNSVVVEKDIEEEKIEKMCNCRKKDECPLSGKCLTDNIIYQATVSTDDGKEETYVGLSSNTFKIRHANHKKSFKLFKYKNETTLSSYVWKIRSEGKTFSINWKILKRAKPFTPVSGFCSLCTSEKYQIIFKPDTASLNTRNELTSFCRHKTKALLDPDIT